MPQLQIRDCCSDARRFQQVVFSRPSTRDGTERARTGADVAENHESCGLVLSPAFGNVGTHGVFADGIELMRTQDFANLEEGIAARNSYFKPIRTLTHCL